MKERPIIMGADSVRAILAGTKTQTRRVYKPRNPEPWELPPGEGYLTDGTPWPMRQDEYGDFWPIPCHFGAPGDRLWVRETWGMSFVDVAGKRPHIVGGEWGSPARPDRVPCVVFRADADAMPDDSPGETARWGPSIFMPRWASRLTLEVTGVRVERLQAISVHDVKAEGIPRSESNPNPTASFRAGWDALNAKRGFGWDANPWVWVVTFRRASDTTAPTRQKGE